MKVEKIYITGTHPDAFRAGEPAEIIGVKMCTPSSDSLIDTYKRRICYHILFSDGQEDYVPITDKCWEISTFSDLIRLGAPEVE